MSTVQQKSAELDAHINGLETEYRRIAGIWDKSIQQFDLVVGKKKPSLIRTHRPWLVHLSRENLGEFRRVMKQLRTLKDLCNEGLSQKPVAEQQCLVEAIDKISGTIRRNAEQLASNCVSGNDRLMFALKRINKLGAPV